MIKKADIAVIVDHEGDERSLITALKSGDREAFSRVITNYREKVVRLCRGYTASHEDAEDIAQESFVELYRSIHKFREEASLSTWIYRIAISRSLNHIRDNKNKFTLFKNNSVGREPDGELSIEGESSDGDIITNDHRRALRSALDKLPVNQKTAFILNKYEDLSYDEISDVMEISHSSVESLIFRAKQNLQKSLLNYYKKNML